MKRFYLLHRKRINDSILAIIFSLVLSLGAYNGRIVPYEEMYKEVTSENYYLKKCDEYGWYDLYDKTGNLLGSSISYGTPLLIENETKDGVVLYAGYEDTNAYIPIEVTQELKEDIIEAMGKVAWYVAPSKEYEIFTDTETGLKVLQKKKSLLYDAHVLLADESDRKAYMELAQAYGEYFSAIDVGSSMDFGDTFAEYEITGMAHRFDDGFLYVQNNAIAFISPVHPDEGWSLTLTYDEWARLIQWIQSTKEPYRFSAYDKWTEVFDALSIEYAPEMNPDSLRYQAAEDWFNRLYESHPGIEISEDRKREQFRNILKEYDKDGYRLGIFGVAGMDATGSDPEEYHVLIDIPESYRKQLFYYEKNRIIKSYGLSWDDGERQILYRNCQLQIDTPDRLKCSWTLGQYDRIYVAALFSTIKSSNPKWEPGDAFDTASVEKLSFAEVESAITTSDGRTLQITITPEVRRILEQTKYDMAMPVMY